MKKAKDIIYVGVDDTTLDLFEGQYVVPEGMSYNSYVIVDESNLDATLELMLSIE